jgi:hypothetical protein
VGTSVDQGDYSTGSSNGISDFINNSSNTGKHITQTVASVTLTELLKKGGRAALGNTAGALVEPAVWVLSGKAPQPGDVALWGGGTVVGILGGVIGGVAVAATGLIKSLVEDNEDKIIAAAIQAEPAQVRPFITSVRAYGTSGRGIVASTIASHGGVAWRVGPATWVFIRDAKGRLICDYKPKFSYETYGPVLPLRIHSRQGKITYYEWRRYPGTHNG